MNTYICLNRQTYSKNGYSIVPLRYEDRYDIMKWRNEQVYHLRQDKLISKKDQDTYFNEVVTALFKQKQPKQILFSYLKDEKCIGYGGLVHINWKDKNAEISFIMKTELEKNYFYKHWSLFLGLIEQIAFIELKLHKIYTYAFNLRPHLYEILEKCDYKLEAKLTDHVLHKNKYISVFIHSKINI